MPSIKRRVARIEARLIETAFPRLFTYTLGRELHGFAPLASCPDGAQTVLRLPSEELEALQSRCAQAHPGVIVWRGIGS